ncbi:hypothetical protein DE146DRAFT_626966 [Phaeosphaeria sp. MPI-PUGE-AT-0046c]|nr:hypothetical protein DE146DRAFT_626966 [Phaeosphaeria sp. MPI-PUGE-AT-0046c]
MSAHMLAQCLTAIHTASDGKDSGAEVYKGPGERSEYPPPQSSMSYSARPAVARSALMLNASILCPGSSILIRRIAFECRSIYTIEVGLYHAPRSERQGVPYGLDCTQDLRLIAERLTERSVHSFPPSLSSTAKCFLSLGVRGNLQMQLVRQHHISQRTIVPVPQLPARRPHHA